MTYRKFYAVKVELELFVETDDSRAVTNANVTTVTENHVKSILKEYSDTGNGMKITRTDVEYCRAEQL